MKPWRAAHLEALKTHIPAFTPREVVELELDYWHDKRADGLAEEREKVRELNNEVGVAWTL